MTTIARNAAANVLLAVILLTVGVGLFLLGASPAIAALAAIVVLVLIKFDDRNIRRKRAAARR